ncbi:MAG: hypothetical protein M3O03_05945, partial [Pseudomonadota bacterium]|nr:hypothetical protein [Pseudomonadota bacterium]
MTVVSLKDYSKNLSPTKPISLTFFSPKFVGLDGKDASVSVTLTVENGDWEGALAAVKENGGLGRVTAVGQLQFVPWPC